MADPEKVGTPWRDDELDAIIEDYFDMLGAELAGIRYVKSRHSAALMAKIGRTHRSVEFKHQNISAVLDELGLPWIAGYMPKRNYQAAIFPAVDRYLNTHPGVLEYVPALSSKPDRSPAVFVDPPAKTSVEKVPSGLQKLVQKFDPVARDHRNRALGKAGEEFVVSIERQRLANLSLPHLAERVRWVSDEDGDGAGFDVASFDDAGNQRLIEVKTTNGTARTPFFLSRRECAVASSRPAEWRIYRVHDFARIPKIFVIAPPLESAVVLTPETWRVSF